MLNRYETVLNWFREYGLQIVKKSDSSINWHETIVKDNNGINRMFEITNNHIWYIGRNDRKSLGKTKTELYLNLNQMQQFRKIKNTRCANETFKK